MDYKTTLICLIDEDLMRESPIFIHRLLNKSDEEFELVKQRLDVYGDEAYTKLMRGLHGSESYHNVMIKFIDILIEERGINYVIKLNSDNDFFKLVLNRCYKKMSTHLTELLILEDELNSSWDPTNKLKLKELNDLNDKLRSIK